MCGTHCLENYQKIFAHKLPELLQLKYKYLENKGSSLRSQILENETFWVFFKHHAYCVSYLSHLKKSEIESSKFQPLEFMILWSNRFFLAWLQLMKQRSTNKMCDFPRSPSAKKIFAFEASVKIEKCEKNSVSTCIASPMRWCVHRSLLMQFNEQNLDETAFFESKRR